MDANVKLHNGVSMPRIGLGGYPITEEEMGPAVRTALDAGYRMFDTAPAYGTEQPLGKALAESIAEGRVSREDVFVISKVWNSEHGYDKALRAYDESLEALGLDYLDLYLIHWPIPKFDKYADTWKALVKLYEDQRVRAIGVSNFNIHHIERIVDETDVVPTVNQVEVALRMQQPELRKYHEDYGIVTMAWGPLGQGGSLTDPVLGEIADKHGRTPAQIVMRWHVQTGGTAIPKSTTPEHIKGNIDVYGFELAAEDLERLAGLNTNTRLGPDPDDFNMA